MEVGATHSNREFCGVFNNNEEGGSPGELRIYSYDNSSKEEIVIKIEFDFPYMFNDVYCIDYAQDRIIFERQNENNTYIDIYNP